MKMKPGESVYPEYHYSTWEVEKGRQQDNKDI
jgi:hypothetical protein